MKFSARLIALILFASSLGGLAWLAPVLESGEQLLLVPAPGKSPRHKPVPRREKRPTELIMVRYSEPAYGDHR